MPRAVAGVLVECDPSIKAIIQRIDSQHGNSLIIEDIDDEHVLIRKEKHDELRELLKNALKDTVREAEESSGSE